jgi:hypothetical protein
MGTPGVHGRQLRPPNDRGGNDFSLWPPKVLAMNIETAYELHQAGRYADAAHLYQALLDRDPEDAGSQSVGLRFVACFGRACASEAGASGARARPKNKLRESR